MRMERLELSRNFSLDSKSSAFTNYAILAKNTYNTCNFIQKNKICQKASYLKIFNTLKIFR